MEASSFAEEIDPNELVYVEIIGRGAFGVVSRAKWKDKDVAVKQIETESEKKAFVTELKQLSRVHHPNIVKLYGACTKPPMVCLVMEYAEGGSLYNVLHGIAPQPSYTLGHAISWCFQCALGVEYLHGMKPRPLIHRDLKPPNLLLICNGKKLKICDFGTACDAQTYMTNNKGSAAWMAPEVFEGSKYSEKCDVFSWGIILWEVLTRLKPFDEIGGSAFRIMWAVHNGTRPPLISNCPKAIQKLMTRCWSANPMERPSINEVVRIMSLINKFCKGGDQPLRYPSQDNEVSGVSLASGSVLGSVYDTPPPTYPSPGTSSNSTATPNLADTIRKASDNSLFGEPVPVKKPVVITKPVVIEDENINWRRTSAPASLAASHESLLDKGSRSSTPNVDSLKRYSADLTKLEQADFLRIGAAMAPNISKPAVRGHRRTGSHGTPYIITQPSTNLLAPNWSPPAKEGGRGHKRTSSYGNSPFSTNDAPDLQVTHSQTAPSSLPSQQMGTSYGVPGSWSAGSANIPANINLQMLDNMEHIQRDYQLQPLPPCESCPESMQIYHEHIKLAERFCRIQVEIKLLEQRNKELQRELAEDEQIQLSNTQLVEQYTRLVTENEHLNLFKVNLKKDIDKWKREHEKDNNSQSVQPRQL